MSESQMLAEYVCARLNEGADWRDMVTALEDVRMHADFSKEPDARRH